MRLEQCQYDCQDVVLCQLKVKCSRYHMGFQCINGLCNSDLGIYKFTECKRYFHWPQVILLEIF